MTAGPCAESLRILLIGINYAPEETGIAPYTTGLAGYLADRGHQVTVMTGLPSYPQWRVYDGYRLRFSTRELINGIDIRRRWHYVPRKQTAVRRALYEASFAVTGLPVLTRARPDLVMGIVPSLSGGVLARLSARRFRVPYSLLFQDLVSLGALQSGVDGGGRVAGLVERLEGWIARDAASIGIIAEGFRAHLERLGADPERIHGVRNWVHVGEPTIDRLSIRGQLGLPGEALICLHAGNMGYKQGLMNVVECARLAASSDPVLFVLMGDGSQRRELEDASRGLPIRFLPVQDELLFPSVLAAADILLVNQRASVTDMSLPGKLTSYFHTGRPIVAAVAPQSETQRELDASGAGIVVAPEDPQALLNAIRDLAADPARREALGSRGKAYARDVLGEEACLAELERWLLDGSKAGAASS